MEKRYAFFVSSIITFLFIGNFLYFNATELFPDREIVVINRVIDGDTVELEDGRIIRLLNINTPEKGKAFSDEAADYLRKFEGKSVELEVKGVGKYGRILGRLYGDEYINLELVKTGLAHKYLIDDFETSDFKRAEKDAREKELGIWEKSEYYGCLNVEINKYDEYVLIEDDCALDFTGWEIKDDSTKSYEFEKDYGSEFRVFSGDGIDNENELFWGRGKIWNNDKDSIFIRDKEGLLVYYDSYGY